MRGPPPRRQGVSTLITTNRRLTLRRVEDWSPRTKLAVMLLSPTVLAVVLGVGGLLVGLVLALYFARLLAKAFDEVHTSAVRLAAQQSAQESARESALRDSVNEIFVSLSRRTQSLVDNQLRMIDGMVATEPHPDQLAGLVELDHLASRMRRNSENLLVLAGAPLRRATTRPVALADMVRAAVSEVEQHNRIVLEPAPDVVVVGAAMSDVVHLLAELLDNATSFSAPETSIRVVCSVRKDGALRIAIADEGIGLSEQELDELNRQLAGAAPIEAAVSKRMGLFVVSRLAARRGISVRLLENLGAGTVAEVTLPGEVVRPAEPDVTLPASEPDTAPIFDELVSAWFSGGDTWSPIFDELWHVGDRLDKPVSDGTTEAGLPRRVKGALLVRGSVDLERHQAEPPHPIPRSIS